MEQQNESERGLFTVQSVSQSASQSCYPDTSDGRAHAYLRFIGMRNISWRTRRTISSINVRASHGKMCCVRRVPRNAHKSIINFHINKSRAIWYGHSKNGAAHLQKSTFVIVRVLLIVLKFRNQFRGVLIIIVFTNLQKNVQSSRSMYSTKRTAERQAIGREEEPFENALIIWILVCN